VDEARIAELLQPFVADGQLSSEILEQLRRYLELLLRWNARINLTAVRDPEQIVTRHFGESLFAARVLTLDNTSSVTGVPAAPETLADLGSGAGFPGIPIKLDTPQLRLTLIESQSKKATFLREVIRTLQLENAEVFCGRAEQWGKTADILTLRAVEQFERTLPMAARLVSPGGRLCLLIGASQADGARELTGHHWAWSNPAPVPLSSSRVVILGHAPQSLSS
jgi:16S rRNA (guanine527-N7)-methyltransferase